MSLQAFQIDDWWLLVRNDGPDPCLERKTGHSQDKAPAQLAKLTCLTDQSAPELFHLDMMHAPVTHNVHSSRVRSGSNEKSDGLIVFYSERVIKYAGFINKFIFLHHGGQRSLKWQYMCNLDIFSHTRVETNMEVGGRTVGDGWMVYFYNYNTMFIKYIISLLCVRIFSRFVFALYFYG